MANYPKNKCGVYEGNTSYINDCIPQELVIDNVRLAAAYIPYQYLCQLFNPIEALKKRNCLSRTF